MHQRRALSFCFVVKCFLNEIGWINVTWFRSRLEVSYVHSHGIVPRVTLYIGITGITSECELWISQHAWFMSSIVCDNNQQRTWQGMLWGNSLSNTYVMSGKKRKWIVLCVYIVKPNSSQQHRAVTGGGTMKLPSVVKGRNTHQYQQTLTVLWDQVWLCCISATALGSLCLLLADAFPGTACFVCHTVKFFYVIGFSFVLT